MRRGSDSISKTSTPCDCNYLRNAAADPACPIVFDEEMGEYHITDSAGGYLMVYHCPLCGGLAKPSKRSTFFAVISPAELDRLFAMTHGLNSIDQVIAAFGSPDVDLPHGLISRQIARGEESPRVTAHRTLKYERLSETADLDVEVHGPDDIRFGLSAKYLGPRTP